MFRSMMLWTGAAGLALVVSGCNTLGKKAEDSSPVEAGQGATVDEGLSEPPYVTVQHILIGFSGSVDGKPISRSRQQAELLALNLLDKAKSGDDFDSLVKQYTDDAHPGIYNMANDGLPGDMSSEDPAKIIFERGEMAPAFGNIGFRLQVGEVDLAPYDSHDSPFGWHLIKRLK